MNETYLSSLKPLICGLEVTLACNLRCRHCGSRAGMPRPDELTTEEWLRLCDDLKALGCQALVLSGGEPLVHPEWDVIAAHAVSIGLKVRMISNGSLVPGQIDRLRASGVSVVGLSIDGLEKTHNHIRGSETSFSDVIRAFDALNEAGIFASAVTHISRVTIGDLPGLYEELRRHRVRAWQIQLAFPAGRMGDHPDWALDPGELEGLAETVAGLRADALPEMQVVAGDNLGYFTEWEPRIRDREWQGCFAGICAIGIESNGNVKGCLSLPSTFVEGNLRQRTLEEIWRDPRAFAFNRYFDPEELQGACSGCEHGEKCRAGCSVTAHTYTGSRLDNPYCLFAARRQG